MKRIYHPINESMARVANMLNSMSDYIEGSATEQYRFKVDEVYDIVEKIAEKKPNLLERAEQMAERYSKKLATYYNKYYTNEAKCPSVLVSGAGNFPTRKKEKQNSRREALHHEWDYLEEYFNKIARLLTTEQPIMSGDANALELLECKLTTLKELQEEMKSVNKSIRKQDTDKGDEELRDMGYTDEEIKTLRTPDFCGRIGFPDYELRNNNSNIKRIEGRIKSLKSAKEKGSTESENRFFKIVENTEIMRLQLFFDGKPEDNVRGVLKSYGFKWSPKNGCWQRQLTSNAKYSLGKVVEHLETLEGAV